MEMSIILDVSRICSIKKSDKNSIKFYKTIGSTLFTDNLYMTIHIINDYTISLIQTMILSFIKTNQIINHINEDHFIE